MADELEGGKQSAGSPTVGETGSHTPDNSGGNKDMSPVSNNQDNNNRSEFIPRERFDQVLETSKVLEAKVAELEAKTNQVTSGQRSWQQIPEQDLQYIVTHSSEYPEHAGPALAEIRRRDKEQIKSEILGEVNVNDFRSSNSEAFDMSTPLGKEVAKIMAANRSQKEILTDVVELAKYRIGGNKSASDARKSLIQNMQTASIMAPGSDGNTNLPPPSYMAMPANDFKKYVESVKLGEFNKK